MIYNSLIYIALATFAIAFALDLAATIRQAWIAATPVAATASTAATITSVASLSDPWDISTASPATPATPVTVAHAPAKPTPQFLLLPAKETAITPATIVSKPPQTSDDYNRVLTVEQLRRKARAAGIKNSAKMRKNELIAALA